LANVDARTELLPAIVFRLAMVRLRVKPVDDDLFPWVFAWLLSLSLGFQAAYLLLFKA
jgi:hypothetical protein